MKTQILLIAMISVSFQQLTATTKCDCEELGQADCALSGCEWNGSCAAQTADCTTFTTQETCDSELTCAWNNSNMCATFTKCSDYTVTDPFQCSAKNTNCIVAPYVNGQYPCRDFPKCSDYSQQTDCERMPNCKWDSSSCVAKDCTDQKAASTCLIVLVDGLTGFHICSWNSSTSKCENANLDYIKALDATTCFTYTSGTYYWDGSTCSQCSGSSSNSYILAFIGFIAILTF